MFGKQSILILLCLVLWLPYTVAAQSEDQSILISAINADLFPEIELTMRLTSPEGRPILGLTASNLDITDAQQPVANVQVETLAEPMAYFYIVDAGSTLTNRAQDPRWNRVKDGILTHSNGPFANQSEDLVDVQVIETGGPLRLAQSEKDMLAVQEGLIAYQPPEGTGYADVLPELLRTLDDIYTDPQYAEIPKQIILMSADLQISKRADIDAVIQKASAFNFPVHTVLLKPTPTPYSNSLIEIAEGTNGSFSVYDDEAGLGRFYDELNLYRTAYRVRFESTSGLSGEHAVSLEIDGVKGETTYDVSVDLPVVDIVDPVGGIEFIQNAAVDSERGATDLPNPQAIVANVSTTPPRRLSNGSLILNGNVVATMEAPGRQLTFELDLDKMPLDLGSSHQLVVEVEDVFGLVGRSQSLPITVSSPAVVEQSMGADELEAILAKERENQAILIEEALLAEREALSIPCLVSQYSERPLLCQIEQGVRQNGLSLFSILFSAGAILFILYIRSTPADVLRTTISDLGARFTQQFWQDEARGYLVIVDGNGATIGRKLPIYGTTPIGRSSAHAKLLFHQNKPDSPISRLHCTLLDQEDYFLLRDEESGNGTFVNGVFVERASPPVRLKTGDEIELGLVEQGGIRLKFEEEVRQAADAYFKTMGDGGRIERSEQTILDDPEEFGYSAVYEPVDKMEDGDDDRF